MRLASVPRVSAGLLMYRMHDGRLQVLLAHPGRRTQKLDLSAQQIRLFEVICVDTVREWTP